MARRAELARDPVPLDVLAERVRPTTLARDQQLPVLPALASLFPDGVLRRGTTVSVTAGPLAGSGGGGGAGSGSGGRAPGPSAGASGGSASESVAPVPVGGAASAAGRGGGATSLALALAAGPSQAGSWVAAVGLGSLGAVAADGFGVALDRLALVDALPERTSGGGERTSWAAVVAALVDGFDVVLVATGRGFRWRPADARRLVARVRERGSVLVTIGGELPERSSVGLSVEATAWQPMTRVGHLHARRVTVVSGGRGAAARPRRAELWLPAASGEVVPVPPLADAVPLAGLSTVGSAVDGPVVGVPSVEPTAASPPDAAAAVGGTGALADAVPLARPPAAVARHPSAGASSVGARAARRAGRGRAVPAPGADVPGASGGDGRGRRPRSDGDLVESAG